MSVTIENHNGHASIITELTIKPDVITYLLSTANRSCPSPDAELLFRLMAGSTLKMRCFSISNIMFYVTSELIDAAVEKAKTSWDHCYLSMLSNDNIERLKSRFGNGQLSMSISVLYIIESVMDIKERLNAIQQY